MSIGATRPRPRVLVALDGSPASATALPLARAVAAQLDASVEILHIASEEPPSEELWRRLHGDLVNREAVHVRSHVGEPAPAILRAATAPDVALLVLTTHGRDVEPGRELGRVARAVIAGTSRPILLVRPESAAGAETPLRRLLLPLDGTPTTAAALQPAAELACRLGASIDLLYVAAPGAAAPAEQGSLGAPRYVDQPQHEWPHWAGEIVDRLCACLQQRPLGVPIQAFIARGDVGGEIAKFAAEHHDDAIVLVRRSQLEPGRARVLRAVLDRTPCPTLVVGRTTD